MGKDITFIWKLYGTDVFLGVQARTVAIQLDPEG